MILLIRAMGTIELNITRRIHLRSSFADVAGRRMTMTPTTTVTAASEDKLTVNENEKSCSDERAVASEIPQVNEPCHAAERKARCSHVRPRQAEHFQKTKQPACFTEDECPAEGQLPREFEESPLALHRLDCKCPVDWAPPISSISAVEL